ncbi:hypothetical protein J7337_010210 [Fusarium musae]|uniref:Peptidase C14 caspase domain-containing protein n=1 Tax=Fusarium musae TaxID=1042133 RepID=A0A9P8D8K1_9HYPO|nr:hypothetical protein J7337_010210 [Fusarium musae]KAG9497350.1 hypothetical protein J7337_010210 [Fusarium musae]
MAKNEPVSPGHHAILIGIGTYPAEYKASLKGCVRDKQQIRSLLEQQPFHINIQTLTAMQTSDSSTTGPVEHPATLLTYDNVIKAFSELADVAQSGDYIYIHSSGHGARMTPETTKPFSNQHTGDLTLVLLGGENGDEVKPLGGYKLAVYLNAMVEKRLVVTLALDCCFAASVYCLDRPNIRFLRTGPGLASAYFADKSLSEQDKEATGSEYRDSL